MVRNRAPHVALLIVLSLAGGVPAAQAEVPLARIYEVTLQAGASVGDRDTGELGQDPGTGIGATVRLSGSIWKLLTDFQSTSAPGIRLTDWWATEVGLGYLRSDDGSIWGKIRVEAGLRLVVPILAELETFVRGGYLTGIDTAGRGLYSGYDALFATVGLRVGKVLAEVGYGGNATIDNDLSYVLVDLNYAMRPLGFHYVGLRVERFAEEGTDITSVNVTISAHY